MNKTQQTFLVTTSWDDGHPLDLRVAELLSRYGLAGTFYIPRSSQKAVMHPSQIRELAEHFEIGGHTLDHIPIDGLSDSAARAQIAGSRGWVEQLTGKSCSVFCFPGGKFRKRQLPFVQEAGYQAARTVELLSMAQPRRIQGLWMIPTTVQAFPHGVEAYARNALKRFPASSAYWRCRWKLSRNWAALANDFFLHGMERGGVFHLWGHSWEIEEQEQWENLEAFLRIVSSYRANWKAVSNGGLCGLAV
ncbi:MAG: polysaccharide deacetylase family protein [Candidatus Acidiferrum sp.]